MHLDDFNRAAVPEARAVVSVWAAIPTWVDAIVAARPYSSVDALAEAAGMLAASWGLPELEAALAHHPRIGEKPSGAGAEAAASRREQASMADADTSVADRIAAGNAAYEQRFGRVFLIRAAGRSPDEILAELQRRLTSDSDAEIAEACDQLAQIALLRLHAAFAEG
ncbi:2-oxo-4-hydroxy-4-carboxy-5-ureidoimidazoline decarboxylase [Microbacter sp. GSS18]|nr:2-oxo-4-hydroxy-4-carboxy-5-ureidoimidazoline decarboxylase [Microbacter sp. GSS18]